MKKVTLSLQNTTNLTDVVRSLAGNSGYAMEVRIALSGSGDDVYVLRNKVSGFTLEFCKKDRKTDGKTFVNWARVYGPEAVVDKFLAAVNYVDYQAKVQIDFNY
jgi:hypothetical protein